MAAEDKVTLYGFWASPFVKRVELALKFKGIPFEYVEEDLANKSSLLISYNPVYKKVPVLVHNGKPISESLIILEYIDETWKNGPKLLPEDPYKKSQVRFWASFLHQQLLESIMVALKTEGEAQEKGIKQLCENLKVLEEGLNTFYPDCGRVSSENLGVLDFVFLSIIGDPKVHEELLDIKVIEPEKTPLVYSWLTALVELPLVKESLPPQEKLVAFLKFIRENALKSSVA